MRQSTHRSRYNGPRIPAREYVCEGLTMRRRLTSLFWNSFVTLKNTSDCSFCTKYPQPASVQFSCADAELSTCRRAEVMRQAVIPGQLQELGVFGL